MPIHVSNITDRFGNPIRITNNRLWTTIANSNGTSVEINEDGQMHVIEVQNDMEGGGKVAVGTTRVEVTFTGTTKSIVIVPDKDNTGILYVGESNVTSAGDNAFVPLEVEDSITLNYEDSANPIYVVASVAGQNFWKGALI